MRLQELFNPGAYTFTGWLKVSRLGGVTSAEVELDDGRVLHYSRVPKAFLDIAQITRPIRIRFKASTENGAMPSSVLRIA